jgi:hypothetical protein
MASRFKAVSLPHHFIVETASRFARDLIVQETDWRYLKDFLPRGCVARFARLSASQRGMFKAEILAEGRALGARQRVPG